jgi:NifU-like protein involved in Fe-S cluster formation
VTRPEDIYSDQLLALVAAMPRTERLAQPQATAKAHSKLCGSTVEVDLVMEGDVVTDYGQTVRACLLGQTAAAIMGREIVGRRLDGGRTARGGRRDAQDAERGRSAAGRPLEGPGASGAGPRL